jgi:hypothetical protein
MLRPSLSTAAIALLCTGAMAQGDIKSRLHPITAPVRNAGIYHVATGTWTRNASIANVTGPDVIYHNTCAAVYFSPMNGLESFQHRSRIPSTSGPTTPSVFYGTAQNDEAPGCHDSYTVNGYQVSYCSSATTNTDWSYDFASSYTLCGGGDMVSQYNIVVTGLPGGGTTGNQKCWLVDLDLSGNSGGGIVLSADGDGTYTPGGPSTGEQFGWSMMQTNQTFATNTGPIIAGDFTWTGGPGTVSGLLTPCTGTDGTIWDNPINLAEDGTGMASNDFMRIAATPGPPQVAAGCYYFGGNPHADFWLKLYANPSCPLANPLTAYCFPGEGGIKACTTCSPNNPPSAHGRGCDNFGGHTGGAQLTAVGSASVANDTIVFTSSFENPTAFTVLMQGTTTSNLVFGAGIRCVAGTLKRLYIAGASGGIFTHPAGADLSVHLRSTALGYIIHPPITLFYLAYYRDPSAASHCGGATFDASQSGSLNWIP